MDNVSGYHQRTVVGEEDLHISIGGWHLLNPF